MSGMLSALYATHVEWLGVRKTLKGQEHRHFHRWVCRVHSALYAPYRNQPALFRQMCQEVRRGGSLPQGSGVGEKTLERYAEVLMARHLANTQEEDFSMFLERVLAQCPTERALKRFLQVK